jgi:hypothetical protein
MNMKWSKQIFVKLGSRSERGIRFPAIFEVNLSNQAFLLTAVADENVAYPLNPCRIFAVFTQNLLIFTIRPDKAKRQINLLIISQ